MVPRKQLLTRHQEKLQHDTWNIPELVQNKPLKYNRYHKLEMDLRRQNSNYEVSITNY